MHELSIAMSILEIAAEEAGRVGATRVKTVHLRLGPLSGVVREALRSAYDLAREHSPLADAQLAIEDVPVVLFCETCGEESPAESIQNLCCLRCGAPAGVVRGRELEIAALEIES